MRIAITGARGFLGWHVGIRLRGLHPEVDVVPIDVDEWPQRGELLAEVDVVLHLAGVNRGPEDEVRDGNVRLATELVDALEGSTARRVVYANSIQAGNGTAYGDGKQQAAHILANSLSPCGVEVVTCLLPNLFGAHGRPYYNSFVPTFVDKLLRGEEPDIADREIALLPAQDAADVLIEACLADAPSALVEPAGIPTAVLDVWHTLQRMHATYHDTADLPALGSQLDVELFNTYRAALFPQHYPMALTRREDNRGWLVETVRAHGGQSQVFVSTTHPGITRGNHYHLNKIERFCVVAGTARISLRRVLTSEVVHFDVTGQEPCVVDMPIGWTHSITNTGSQEVVTVFWTHELFDPNRPDTHPEPVLQES